MSLGRIPERTGADGTRPGLAALAPSFTVMKWCSFLHSAIYVGLLACWIGGNDTWVKTALGWGHGWGWIIMCVLTLAALRARVIPVWLAGCVAVIGAVGPFVGSAGFVVEQRRRERASRA
ncbi:hypothetical protein [Patulibacter minatonensis]|uniref:hypothetical protein n=1 Tax=Patulibacter minatonensis TaxID=298163 RepID=UPI000478D2A3|nr:hypothetical protein [Patulibacter minatonensis]